MSKMYAFGSGTLFATRTDLATQTAFQFGALQDISLDFSFDTKMLYGQTQYPLAVGRGKGKVTGKAKLAQFNANGYNSVFLGATLTTGQTLVSLNEAGTIPGTPYQITVTNSATWVADQGVLNAVTGVPLVLVASAPATGQYSVAAGVYTFAAADTTNTLYISYTYTASATGKKTTVANQLMGTAPTFSAVFYETFGGNVLTVKLLQCISNKLNFTFKNDDFSVSDFEFDCFADSAGNIYEISLTNA